MLHGAPTGTYSKPSGPKRMNFQPWWVSVGKRSFTTTGLGGLRSRGLDAVEAQDAVHLGHVQRAVAEGHAVGHVEAGGERDELVSPVAVGFGRASA